jgi:hypothetical protein
MEENYLLPNERRLFNKPLILKSDCCNNIEANDCMKNNKIFLGGLMLMLGIIIGVIITVLIYYYILK